MGFKLPRKKTIEKYFLLRNMDIPYKEAKEITRCCHGFLSWIDPKSNFAKEAIKTAQNSKLKGTDALNAIKNYVKEELDNYSRVFNEKEQIFYPLI